MVIEYDSVFNIYIKIRNFYQTYDVFHNAVVKRKYFVYILSVKSTTYFVTLTCYFIY